MRKIGESGVKWGKKEGQKKGIELWRGQEEKEEVKQDKNWKRDGIIQKEV